MTAAFWGTLAGVVILFAAAALNLINTPEPAGAHHKPSRRRREARGEAQPERIFVHVRADTSEAQAAIDHIQRKLSAASADVFGTGDEPGPAMPVPAGPLMPLPPGEYYDAYDNSGEPAAHLTPGQITVLSGQRPADPLAVPGDDEVADAYVGPAEPEPAPLFDTSADHWHEETLMIPAVKL